MNDKTIALVREWASQLQGTILHTAPQVWHVLVAVKRAQSLGDIITALLAVILLAYIAKRLWQNCQTYWTRSYAKASVDTTQPVNMWYERRNDGGVLFIAGISGTGSVLAGLGALAFTLFTLLNQWEWIGIFAPDLALAHDIVAKITGG